MSRRKRDNQYGQKMNVVRKDWRQAGPANEATTRQESPDLPGGRQLTEYGRWTMEEDMTAAPAQQSQQRGCQGSGQHHHWIWAPPHLQDKRYYGNGEIDERIAPKAYWSTEESFVLFGRRYRYTQPTCTVHRMVQARICRNCGITKERRSPWDYQLRTRASDDEYSLLNIWRRLYGDIEAERRWRYHWADDILERWQTSANPSIVLPEKRPWYRYW